MRRALCVRCVRRALCAVRCAQIVIGEQRPRIDSGSNNRMQNQAGSNVVLKTRKDDTENRLYRPESVFAYNRCGRGGEAVGLSARPPRLYYSTTDTRKQDENMCNNMQQHANTCKRPAVRGKASMARPIGA